VIISVERNAIRFTLYPRGPAMTAPYEAPDLTGTAITWGDAPATHGGEYVYPGRRVAVIPGRVWPSTPEVCEAGMLDTEWLAGGTLLVCTGCGLDCT
jgi:hypothetical protein